MAQLKIIDQLCKRVDGVGYFDYVQLEDLIVNRGEILSIEGHIKQGLYVYDRGYFGYTLTDKPNVITYIERKDVLTRLAHKDILTLISFCVVILPCIIMISENLPSALCGAGYWAFLAVVFSTDRGHRYMKSVEKSYYNIFKDDERE